MAIRAIALSCHHSHLLKSYPPCTHNCLDGIDLYRSWPPLACSFISRQAITDYGGSRAKGRTRRRPDPSASVSGSVFSGLVGGRRPRQANSRNGRLRQGVAGVRFENSPDRGTAQSLERLSWACLAFPTVSFDVLIRSRRATSGVVRRRRFHPLLFADFPGEGNWTVKSTPRHRRR